MGRALTGRALTTKKNRGRAKSRWIERRGHVYHTEGQRDVVRREATHCHNLNLLGPAGELTVGHDPVEEGPRRYTGEKR
jgi:hypothetical protein